MSSARVFVNGEFVGTNSDPISLAKEMRRLRRGGKICNQINVSYFARTNEILINTDSGRARRPLIVVEGGSALVTEEHVEKVRRGEITFDDLVREGLVEYLDAEEEENARWRSWRWRYPPTTPTCSWTLPPSWGRTRLVAGPELHHQPTTLLAGA